MVRRLFGTALAVLSAVVMIGGTAHAEEKPMAWHSNTDVVHGRCAATLLNGRGAPLVVDADALLVECGLPGARLGSSTVRVGDTPARYLPVGDAVELLRLNEGPLAAPSAALCAAVDDVAAAVNAVGRSTRAAVPAGSRPFAGNVLLAP